MKMLHVIGNLSPDQGGPPKAALEMSRALARHGHDVSLYTTNAYGHGTLAVPTYRPLIIDRVNVHYFPIGRFRRWWFSWPLGCALRNHVVEFDIVHIHSLYIFHTLVAAHYCRRYGVPYLIRPHGTFDPFLRRKSRVKKAIYNYLVEKRNLDGAAAIHYTSQDEMTLAHRPLRIRAPGVVVPLGIDLEEYATLPPRGTLSIQFPEVKDKRIILFLGRLNFKKGLDILSRAYGQLARRLPDVHLVIAGPDEEGYGQQVRRWLAEEGVQDRVTFAGMLTGRDKLAAFAGADVFVLPSYTENFGIAVVEAMACGVPVIISNKVSIWREVDEAEAGLIIGCDPEELVRAILQLMDNPNRSRQLGVNGRQLVERRFTWDKATTEMADVYRQIVGQHRY